MQKHQPHLIQVGYQSKNPTNVALDVNLKDPTKGLNGFSLGFNKAYQVFTDERMLVRVTANYEPKYTEEPSNLPEVEVAEFEINPDLCDDKCASTLRLSDDFQVFVFGAFIYDDTVRYIGHTEAKLYAGFENWDRDFLSFPYTNEVTLTKTYPSPFDHSDQIENKS